LIAYASSFDQIGLVSQHVEDLSTVLSVIAGPDPMDSTCLSTPTTPLEIRPSTKKYKIATIKEISNDPAINSQVAAACNHQINQLKAKGHEVEAISFDLLPYLVPTYYVLTTAEASSNLSRYDGIRYGHRSEEITDINSLYINSRSEGFGMEVKRRIMMGTFVLSVGHYEAYFAKAQSVRRKIVNRLLEVFSEYDFILMPTTTNSAPKIGDMNPMEMYLSDVFTVLANIGGLPAISLPSNNIEGTMPVGVQLLAAPQNDEELLSLSLSLAK
jgi:aspartyl-tRNA(Asn)/glutamyl-tRNA(Gln) amidotransferase subunit A